MAIVSSKPTIPGGNQNSPININWKFPLTQGPQGFFDSNLTIQDATKENLKMVVFTRQGERIVRGDYGAGIENYLFEPNTPEKKAKIQSTLISSINRFVRNVNVQMVSVVYPEDLIPGHPLWQKIILENNQILIVLQYTILTANPDFYIPNQNLSVIMSPFQIVIP